MVGQGSADDGAARWLHHNTNNIISHRMSAGAIDVDDMRAKFEGRFMEKGGVCSNPNPGFGLLQHISRHSDAWRGWRNG